MVGTSIVYFMDCHAPLGLAVMTVGKILNRFFYIPIDFNLQGEKVIFMQYLETKLFEFLGHSY